MHLHWLKHQNKANYYPRTCRHWILNLSLLNYFVNILEVSWVWTLTWGWGWRCLRYWGVAHNKSFNMWIIVEISRFGRPNRSCKAGFNVPENVPLNTPGKKVVPSELKSNSWKTNWKQKCTHNGNGQNIFFFFFKRTFSVVMHRFYDSSLGTRTTAGRRSWGRTILKSKKKSSITVIQN